MYTQEYATNIRILNVSSLAGASTLKALIDTQLATKTGPAATLPPGTILQVALTPSANLSVADVLSRDNWTHPLNVRHFYPVKDALEKLLLTGIATVTVELYFGR